MSPASILLSTARLDTHAKVRTRYFALIVEILEELLFAEVSIRSARPPGLFSYSVGVRYRVLPILSRDKRGENIRQATIACRIFNS